MLSLSKKIAVLNLPFIVTTFGIVTILLWIGSFKFEAVEANGIAPLVTGKSLLTF